jgi:uncharacterized membrane protein YcaP (DUF421 family)
MAASSAAGPDFDASAHIGTSLALQALRGPCSAWPLDDRREMPMFDLSVPWWELPLRAAFIYAVLLVFVRLSGKRTVGQFTPFDLLVVVLLSESVSSGLVGSEDSVTGGLLAAATLIALNLLVALLTARSVGVQKLVEGDPVLIGRDGKFDVQRLKNNHVPLEDVERALREADCDLKDMKYAFLEADGGISVLKESTGAVKQGRGSG